MEAGTQEKKSPLTPEEEREALGAPPHAPQPVVDSAAGRKVDEEGEEDVLGFLLGETLRPEYAVPVKFETVTGTRSLTFVIKALDDRKMQEIDKRHRKGGAGPFQDLDETSFNAELVAEATVLIRDDSGNEVKPTDERFLGGIPAAPIAMETRFKYQPGILSMLAEQVRQVSGYKADRVGSAQRVLVDAAGGS